MNRIIILALGMLFTGCVQVPGRVDTPRNDAPDKSDIVELLEIQRIVHGFADEPAYCDLGFGAPMLYYFDTSCPDFQKTVASFQMAAGSKKTVSLQ